MQLVLIFAAAGLLTSEALSVKSPDAKLAEKEKENEKWASGVYIGSSSDLGKFATEPGGVMVGLDGIYYSAASSDEKKALINKAMMTCTDENQQTLAERNPMQKIKAGFNQEPFPGFASALTEGSFYAKLAEEVAGSTRVQLGCKSSTRCRAPQYLAPRKKAKDTQTIPRIIWMTMSDRLIHGEMGAFQYRLLAEYYKKNEEYEFIISGDSVSDEFMKSPEVKKEWQQAYTKARNGAEKADIWRYAVMYLYGGVYMDADMTAITSFEEVFDGLGKDASFIQQFTEKNHGYETATYGMFFTPGNQLLEDLLDEIAKKYASGETLPKTIDVTGPKALAHIYAKNEVCGVQACLANADKVCNLPAANSCQDEKLGKAVLLWRDRDFNTGKVWHKSDVCAMKEMHELNPHWTEYSAEGGGKKKEEKATH